MTNSATRLTKASTFAATVSGLPLLVTASLSRLTA